MTQVLEDPVTYDPAPAPQVARARRDLEPARPPAAMGPSVGVYARSPAVRAGLRELLESAGLEVTSQPGPGADLPEADVLVIDAPEGVEEAIARAADGAGAEGLRVVLLVDYLPADIVGANGASTAPRGWLRREATEAELHAAVVALAAGLSVVDPALERRPGGDGSRAALTDREHEVLALVALGMTNRAIALALGISEHTAKFHVGAMLAKLEAQSRAEAVSVAVRLGILAL